MGDDYIHNIDPLWFKIGIVGFQYYELIFLATFVLGYFFWRWQAFRGGQKKIPVRIMGWALVPAILLGAHLGHCLFYYPKYYLEHPLELMIFWSGGYASHGATISIVLSLVVYAKVTKSPVLDISDRFSFSSAVGATLIRLGNFFNSEIVGRETTVPWGMRFMRYDSGAVLRHPSQLYEVGIGLVVLFALIVIDRLHGGERRRVGLLSGAFLSIYFSLRFIVEFFKEHQSLEPSSVMTLGQYLSILPFFVGLWLVRGAVQGKWGAANDRSISITKDR